MVPELPDALAMLNPIWRITATAALKVQGRGRRRGIQISSFSFSFPGLWVAQPITQWTWLRVCLAPWSLNSWLQHRADFDTFPLCSLCVHARRLAQTNHGAWPAVRSPGKWETRIQALCSHRGNWTELQVRSSCISALRTRIRCRNSKLFSRVSKWVRQSRFCVCYQERVNLYLKEKLEWHHSWITRFKKKWSRK